MRARLSAVSLASPRPPRVASARELSRGGQPLVGFRGVSLCLGADPPCVSNGSRGRLSLVAGAACGAATSSSSASSSAALSRPLIEVCRAPWGPMGPQPRGCACARAAVAALAERALSAPAASSASPHARPCSRPAVLSCGTSFPARSACADRRLRSSRCVQAAGAARWLSWTACAAGGLTAGGRAASVAWAHTQKQASYDSACPVW